VADSGALTEAVKAVMQCLSEKRFQDAIAVHAKMAGSAAFQQELVLRSQMQIKRCKSCDQHWLKFSVSKRSRDDWKDIDELGYQCFCAEPINVESVVAQTTLPS
jgi:hypothetical protein